MSTDSPEPLATTGELRWNIKQSFRDYVAELPDGSETWTGESGGIDGGDLVFPATRIETAADGAVTLKFVGAVRYQGHYGMLRVDVSAPWIEVDDAGRATLTVDVAPDGSTSRRAAILSIEGAPTLTDGGWSWAPSRTSLTVAGAALLGSVYEPGSDADGFSLRVTGA